MIGTAATRSVMRLAMVLLFAVTTSLAFAISTLAEPAPAKVPDATAPKDATPPPSSAPPAAAPDTAVPEGAEPYPQDEGGSDPNAPPPPAEGTGTGTDVPD